MRTDNKRGLSLAELLVGIIVAGIVVLMVSALGSMAYQSYNGLRSHSDVYNDSQFALQLIREGVRQSIQPAPTVSGSCLTIVTAAGTKYFYTMPSGTPTSLVYGTAGCGSPTNESIISGVQNTATNPFTFTPTVNGPPVTLVTVALSGTKNGSTFNYTMNANRRNL